MCLTFSQFLNAFYHYIIVWHPTMKKDVQLLEKVQHRTTKIIPSLCRMSYEDRLEAIKLLSLTIIDFETMLLKLKLSNIFMVFTTWKVLFCKFS